MKNKHVSRSNAVAIPPSNIVPMSSHDTFIVKAMEQGDIETIERMVALKERWEAGEAKKAYHAAMSKFQKERPELIRTKAVKHGGTIVYHFCPMSEMEKTIKEPLFNCGLSYQFQNVYKDGKEGIRCVVTHVQGHSEYSELFANPEESGLMNTIQSMGSRNSYLERYTLKSILSLSSADEDDDGQSSGETPYVRLVIHNNALRDNLEVVSAIKNALKEKDYLTCVEYTHEMDRDSYGALFVRESKGGIFTNDEQEILRSDHYGKAVRQYHADKNKGNNNE